MIRILGALTLAVVVVASLVAGTMAAFQDTESSSGNEITADALDLKVDQRWEIYSPGVNGIPQGITFEAGNDDAQIGTTLTISERDGITASTVPAPDLGIDVTPGQYGIAIYSWHNVETVSADLDVTVSAPTDFENVRLEPEESAGDTTAGATDGELAPQILVHIWHDEDCDLLFDDPAEASLFGIGGADMLPDTGAGSKHLSDLPTTFLTLETLEPLDAIINGGDDQTCVGLNWLFEDDGGSGDNNKAMTDSSVFSVTGTLTQAP
ncbi:MAG: SipW-dependent-type signal peptide-containing protein [Dehalococcoidia bacterium]